MSNITQNLKIDSNSVEITKNLNTSDPVLKAIKKYEKVSSEDEEQINRKAEEEKYVILIQFCY